MSDALDADNPFLAFETSRQGGAPAASASAPPDDDNPFLAHEMRAARGAGAPSVTIRDVNPSRADEAPGFGERLASAFGATQRGAADALTFGLAPRVRAATGAAINAAQGQGFDYSDRLAQERAREGEDQRSLPYARLGGQLLGGVALPAGMGVPGGLAPAGAGLGELFARGAAAGAIQGAAQAAGSSEDLTNLPDVARNAQSGALVGGAIGGVGGVAAPALEGAARLGRDALEATQLPSAIRSWRDPESEAARRVARALDADARAGGRGLDPADLRALQAGVVPQPRPAGGVPPNSVAIRDAAPGVQTPAVLADTGDRATLDLARAAKNTSAEAATILHGFTNDRFEGQNSRISALLQNAGAGNTVRTLDELKQAADDALKPLYDRARADGAAGVWSDTLGELTRSPAVADAIRKADRIGADRAALAGRKPPMNPFTMEAADGSVQLRTRRTMLPDGRYVDAPVRTPSLDFWDNVKRGLDDKIEAAYGAGNRAEGGRLAALKNRMVGELDAAVPTYAAARGMAARAFGAEDALEAGQKFATARGSNDEYRGVIAAMTPPEKQLFAHGYASALMRRAAEAGDRRDLTKIIGANPAERERIEMALGKGAGDRIAAHLEIERVMDRLRTAVQGNSTTAAQLVAMGALGGGAGYALGDGDPRNIGVGTLLGALLSRGHTQLQAKVSTEVAKMLTSSDPAVYRRAVDLVQGNGLLRDRLRQIAAHGAQGLIPLAVQGQGQSRQEAR